MSVLAVSAPEGVQASELASGSVRGRTRVFQKGALLWARGQASQSLFLVKRGEVEIVVPGHKSRDTVIRVVKPGEICGLACLNRGRKPATTGRALVQTEALEIAGEDFFALLLRSPRLARSVLLSACERLDFAEERIHILAQKRAEDRIIALLLQLAQRRGHASMTQPDFVRLAVTHAELARISGMNRAHVSVVLNRLRKMDLIRYQRGSPPQLNMPALLRHAES